MTGNWNDYNDAEAQASFDLIPKGTIAPVRMTIRPGGFDDHSQGWTGGFATRNESTASVYLNCEFIVTEGPFARRKVWSLIGLFSPKGQEWANMGRSFIRGILNSARGISEKDTSQQAMSARRINGFADLDGVEFLAKIDVEKDSNSEDKNVIKFAITPDHKEYQPINRQGGYQQQPATAQQGAQPAYAQSQPAQQTQPQGQSNNPTRPQWAQ
ncbi:MAG: hypothetical protein HQL72_03590 [Magnetococcales bacterium]|nr:hypothetical protein [Magnetococcales bacterium]